MAEAATQDEALGAVATERSNRHIASGWYGMWWLVVTEGALFAYLLFSYIYSLLQVGESWPPDGPPSLKLALPNTFILIASSVVIWFGERAGRRGRKGLEIGLLVLTILLGTVFVGIQLKEWSDKTFSYDTHLYGSFYFTVTGFHMAHVVAGILGLTVLALWLAFGKRQALGPGKELHQRPLSIGSIYWHFVDVVWLAVFTTFYLEPYWR
jgi:heme/copper-type cytochrome/quinol oxidase subunit 3